MNIGVMQSCPTFNQDKYDIKNTHDVGYTLADLAVREKKLTPKNFLKFSFAKMSLFRYRP
jgi:hypothetical protein